MNKKPQLGYPQGKWPRMFKNWPYDKIPVGASLIFWCPIEGEVAINAAAIWGRRNGVKFTTKKTRLGLELKRIS